MLSASSVRWGRSARDCEAANPYFPSPTPRACQNERLDMPNVLYLHGFASSSRSSKGIFLARRFAESGAPVARPDLDEGDFRDLTISGQLRLVASLAAELRPVFLIGSSLGGYLAALHAARDPATVRALVLLAPAFDFPRRLGLRLGAGTLEQWRQDGSLAFHHYRYGRPLPLAYRFYEDALQYEAFPDVAVPTRILHGRRDESVDPALSAEYARGRPNVEVEWLDSDHGLGDVLEEIWRSVAAFYHEV